MLSHDEAREKLRKREFWLNPTRLVIVLAISVFTVELGVMHLLHFYSPFGFVTEEYLDATLLLLLLAPALYFFHYRPIRRQEERQVGMLNMLLASEERFQLALQATDDGVFDWDVASDRFLLSQRFRERLGTVEGGGDWEMQTLLGLMHQDDRGALKNGLRDHLEGRTERLRLSFRLLGHDGDYLQVLGRGQVVERDALGEPLRLVGLISIVPGE